MSHYTKLRTRITDADGLVKALADVGFENVEAHETARNLFGVQNDSRSQTGEVIVPRRCISPMSNDIVFKRQPDGTFEAHISEYDRRKYSQAWLDRLTQRYAYHMARAKLAEQGFDLVSEEVQGDMRIHLVLRRVV